mmetsp:Transcript_197/g.301  ORF Transcript_197/g.301 Transcript_197/m.301 type:complete len:573 (+) Transcript_197:52-1770(+)
MAESIQELPNRKLSEEQTINLRSLIYKELTVNISGRDLEDDASDLLDYALAMIANGKGVDYIIDELSSMEMEVCNADAARRIGNIISEFMQQFGNGENLSGGNSMQEVADDAPLEEKKKDSTSTTSANKKISLRSVKSNALTMSGALGQSRVTKKEHAKESKKGQVKESNKGLVKESKKEQVRESKKDQAKESKKEHNNAEIMSRALSCTREGGKKQSNQQKGKLNKNNLKKGENEKRNQTKNQRNGDKVHSSNKSNKHSKKENIKQNDKASRSLASQAFQRLAADSARGKDDYPRRDERRGGRDRNAGGRTQGMEFHGGRNGRRERNFRSDGDTGPNNDSRLNPSNDRNKMGMRKRQNSKFEDERHGNGNQDSHHYNKKTKFERNNHGQNNNSERLNSNNLQNVVRNDVDQQSKRDPNGFDASQRNSFSEAYNQHSGNSLYRRNSRNHGRGRGGPHEMSGRGGGRGRGEGRGSTFPETAVENKLENVLEFDKSTISAAEASPSPLVGATFSNYFPGGRSYVYPARGFHGRGRGRGFSGRGFPGRVDVAAIFASKTWTRSKDTKEESKSGET